MKSHASLFLLFGLVAGCSAQVGERSDSTAVDQSTAAYSSSTYKPLLFRAVTGDFDGDHKADFGVKTDDGVFFINYAIDGYDWGRHASPDGWDARFGGYGPLTSVPTLADYDHDGKTDLSVKEPSTGTWFIDYARDGFGSWNESHTGYGDASAVPVPADYDDDGSADLSVKDASGYWHIDLAYNGFGRWDLSIPGYGPSSSTPVPADYDGDGFADLSVKASDGTWYIDYARNSFGKWDWSSPGYGNNSNQLVPADYDGDHKADISIKVDDGNWFIDYAKNGFGHWDVQVGGHGVGSRAQAIPGDYDFDGKADLAIDDEQWHVDLSWNGFATKNLYGAWDHLPYLGVPIPPTPTGLHVAWENGWGNMLVWNPIPYAESVTVQQFIPGHLAPETTIDLTTDPTTETPATGYEGTICFDMVAGNGAGGGAWTNTYCNDGSSTIAAPILAAPLGGTTRSSMP